MKHIYYIDNKLYECLNSEIGLIAVTRTYHTVKNIYVNLTELPGSPTNRQYYFIRHILTANL